MCCSECNATLFSSPPKSLYKICSTHSALRGKNVFCFVFSESTLNISTMKVQRVHLYSVKHFTPLLLGTFFVQRAIYASLFLLTGLVKQSIPSQVCRGVFQCATNLKDCGQQLWRKRWHPTPVLLPGKSHGRRSLVGCSPWGRLESDTTERLHFHFSFYALEKEMSTHSSVLAWRIPGTGEPGGLPSMGSHRVGHD